LLSVHCSVACLHFAVTAGWLACVLQGQIYAYVLSLQGCCYSMACFSGCGCGLLLRPGWLLDGQACWARVAFEGDVLLSLSSSVGSSSSAAAAPWVHVQHVWQQPLQSIAQANRICCEDLCYPLLWVLLPPVVGVDQQL
jgi:hypothetical protein